MSLDTSQYILLVCRCYLLNSYRMSQEDQEDTVTNYVIGVHQYLVNLISIRLNSTQHFHYLCDLKFQNATLFYKVSFLSGH